MDITAFELDQAQILIAHKQSDRVSQIAASLSAVPDCDVRITQTDNIKDTARELDSARFDLVLCDRRLLTVKLIEVFNRLRSRGEGATTILLSNEPDEKVRHTGRAIGALDAIPLDVVNAESLAHYIHIALRLGTLSQHDNQAGQVLNAVGTFGDVFFYRGRIDDNQVLTMDWLSSSFEELTGFPPRDFLGAEGGLDSIILDEDKPKVAEWANTILNNHRAICEHRIHDSLGREKWLEVKGQPIWNSAEQRVVGVLGRVRDVNQRRSLEEKTHSLEQHQSMVAELGQICSKAKQPADVVRQIPKLVANSLGCDVCGIFELKGVQFALSGSHGWKLNSPSDRFIPAHSPNELNFTLASEDAVIIDAISNEQRFTPSHIVFSNNAQSGVCIPIKNGKYQAVLAVYSRSHFSPSYDELRFLYTLMDYLGSLLGLENAQAPVVSAPKQVTSTKADTVSLAVHAGCQQLLDNDKWQNTIESALQLLGDNLSASHAALFDVNADEDANYHLGLRYEWTQPGQTPLANKSKTKEFTLSDMKLSRLEEPLRHGESVMSDTNKNTGLLRHFNTKQAVLVPVIVDSIWWGCVAFLNREDPWTPQEVDRFYLFSMTLSTIIQRQRMQGRMSAVIEGTANTRGSSFLNTLAKHLTSSLECDICHIAKIDTVNNTAEVLSNWVSGEYKEGFTHDMALSPTSRLLEGDLVYYAEDTSHLFPADEWLEAHKIQGFLGVPIKSDDSDLPLGYVAVMHTKPIDVAEHDLRIVKLFAERAGAELSRESIERENRMLSSMPQESPSPIISCNLKGQVQYYNPAAEKAVGELNLAHPQELLPKEHLKLVTQSLTQTDSIVTVEHTIQEHCFEWSYHAHPQQGRVQLYAVDLTQRRQDEDQARQNAFNDPLTGLPNRGFFRSLLTHSLEKAERSAEYHFGVLVLDLDRFKVINDSLGHSVGDSFLQQIATRLVDNVRPGDYVARLGGDEYAILMDGIRDEHEATDMAAKLQKEIQKPVNLDGHETVTSASIGIALSMRGYKHIEDIMRDADSAMYHAKNGGKAQHAIFSSEMYEHAVNLLELESDLRRSIKQEELRVHYQPIVRIANDTLVGFEALVRWEHPRRGLLYPDDFIPLAEETGFVRELDTWMLNNATNQLQVWKNTLPNAKDLHLSLNLSGLHFDSMEILSHLGHLLTSKDLSGHLKLEITESVLMQNSSRAVEMFNILHARGLGISIDDFGVGYSSLTRLKRLPIGTLKIDRSFVQHMEDDQASLDIIRTIIDLAYNLKMEVVAEGVETPNQYKLLKRLGCHYAQGFYLARALPEEDATKYISTPIDLSA